MFNNPQNLKIITQRIKISCYISKLCVVVVIVVQTSGQQQQQQVKLEGPKGPLISLQGPLIS